MNLRTIRKFKWIWAWQDEQEEAWLRAMSAEGYHLQKSHGFGLYTFACGEPADYTYRLDYIVESAGDSQSYYQLFQDAGWEFIGAMAGWQYFRMPSPTGEDPQIYTDPESKIKKYERLMGRLLFFLPIYVVFFVVLDDFRYPLIGVPLTVLMFSAMVVFAYAIIKIIQRINQLKRR